AHANLGAEVHDDSWTVAVEESGDASAIDQVQPLEMELRIRCQAIKPGLLQLGVVVVVQVVEADDGLPFVEEPLRYVKPDETGGSGNQDGSGCHARRILGDASPRSKAPGWPGILAGGGLSARLRPPWRRLTGSGRSATSASS